jgi:integral membrane protein (TIGR01906 family)
MKVPGRLAQVLFILCLPLLALTAAGSIEINTPWVYTSGFARWGVQETLAENGLTVSRSDLNNIAHSFIRYFNNSDEYIQITVPQSGRTVELFTQQEAIHFRDVKVLFRTVYAVALGTLLYCVAYASAAWSRGKGKYRRRLAKSAVIGGGLALGILALMGLGLLTDFDQLFYQFHLIAFTNTFWSAEGNMLLLFPEGFWYDVVTYWAVSTAAIAAVVTVLGAAWLARHRAKETTNGG